MSPNSEVELLRDSIKSVVFPMRAYFQEKPVSEIGGCLNLGNGTHDNINVTASRRPSVESKYCDRAHTIYCINDL